jgi:hypothetical protein
MSGIHMRRWAAIPILILMVASFLAPAVLASVTAPTPACCRVGGQHHCSASIETTGVQLRGQGCPYRKALSFSRSAATYEVVQPIAPADAHPFLHEFYPDLFVSSAHRTHPQRGPPQTSSK